MNGHMLAMALRDAYLAMHRRTDAALASVGITADQFVLLAELSAGDAIRQKDLAERTSTDANTLRAMLVLLERGGLIERTEHPADRRARGVALTAAGRAALRRAWRKSEAVRRELIAGVGSRAAGTLEAKLRRLADSMPSRSKSTDVAK